MRAVTARLTCLALAATLTAGCAVTGQPAAEPTTGTGEAIPEQLSITSPRFCAALAVYELATVDDWGLRAGIARAALNGFATAGRVPDCAEAWPPRSPVASSAPIAGRTRLMRWTQSMQAITPCPMPAHAPMR